VFATQGAIIPLATNPKEGALDIPQELDIHIFPGAENTFTLMEDKEDSVFKTTFTLQSHATSLSLQISSDSISMIQRTFHIHIRSIDLESTIACSSEYEISKDIDRNTLILSIPFDMKETITIDLSSTESIISNPYSFTKEIMQSIDISSLDTEEKNDIGFINYNNIYESRGWLAKDNTLLEKLEDLNHLNIPKYAKKFLYDTTIKAIKNKD